MSKLNGFAVIAKVGSAANSTTKIPAQTDSTIEFTTEKEDTTTKDASVDQTTGYLFPEEEVTSVKGVITVTCLKDDTTANGVKIGTTVYWTFVSGGDEYSGQATVDRLREGGQVKGKATLELTLNTVGAISGIS
jgi:hypothetical protein